MRAPHIPPSLAGRPTTLTPKLRRSRDPWKTLAGWNLPVAQETRDLVTALGRGDGPVIVGPWLSETGFELLYWIPFLVWAQAYGNLDPARLTVVSRGGAAPWYGPITANYVDVFTLYSPDEFRARNEARIREQKGRMKHVEVTSVDREIIARVAERRGLRNAALLHPSVMYRLFEHFWLQRAPVTLVEAFTSFAPLPPAPLGDLAARLPSRYVAAKFYGNTALPATPENRAVVTAYLQELSSRVDVVLLTPGGKFDEHEDVPVEAGGRIHRVDHLMTPDTNLAVQTRIIGGADAFVGTYGGFSYLAPFSGTDALAFYSDPTGFRFDHLEIAKRVFAGLGRGAFVELDVTSMALMRLGFGGA